MSLKNDIQYYIDQYDLRSYSNKATIYNFISYVNISNLDYNMYCTSKNIQKTIKTLTDYYNQYSDFENDFNNWSTIL